MIEGMSDVELLSVHQVTAALAISRTVVEALTVIALFPPSAR
jgi:hypothetical protein